MHNYRNTIIKRIATGRKRYYETLYKPRFILLDRLMNKLSKKLLNLSYYISRLNRKYNEIEYEKMRYRTIYKTEYI